MPQRFSCGFFVDPGTGRILLQLRDGHAPVNPHKWGFFGGSAEGSETPVECFVREIREELDVALTAAEIEPLYRYAHPRTGADRSVFLLRRYLSDDEITLGEGADYGWFFPRDVFELDLTEGTRADLTRFLKRTPQSMR